MNPLIRSRLMMGLLGVASLGLFDTPSRRRRPGIRYSGGYGQFPPAYPTLLICYKSSIPKEERRERTKEKKRVKAQTMHQRRAA